MNLVQALGFRRESRAAAPVEVRAPKAATMQTQYTSVGQSMVAEWDADAAIRNAFLSNVIVYRCVQIIANTIASLPFRAGVDPNKPESHDPNCRLAQLLGPPPGGPAPKLSARRLWAWTVAQRLVTGRHGWEIDYDRNAIAALWPLTSAQLQAVPSKGGTEWFTKFRYGPIGDQRTLQPEQIVYGWDPSATDFRQPESPLQAARLDISVAVMMDRYNYAFLRNDARPAALIVLEQFANDDEFQAFKEQWLAEFRGTSNAGKPLFMTASPDGDGPVSDTVSIQQLGLSQKDAMFVDQHRDALSRIAMALGVPWSKLDASKRTFDNAGEEDEMWWHSTILPKLVDLQDEVNMQLAPLLGKEVGWFDLSDVDALQPKRKFVDLSAVPGLIQVGALLPEEWRDDYDLTAELPEAPEPDAPALPPAPNPDIPGDELNEPDRAAPVPQTREIDHDARRAKVWVKTNATILSLERTWQREFVGLFARQERETIKRLEGKRGRQMLSGTRASGDEIFDAGYWAEQTRDEVLGLYEQVATLGGIRVSELFELTFDVEAPYVQDFIVARSNKLAGGVTDTTYSAIKDQLAKGIEAGEDIPSLAARVRHVFDVAKTSRATMIARTEVISAYNGSASLVASELPSDVVAAQEWISTRDGRTRIEHAEADGQYVSVGQPFSVGGALMMYPGDPSGGADNTINCRCTVGFLTPDEVAERGGQLAARRIELRTAQALIEAIPEAA